MNPVTAAIYSRISHDPEGRQAGVERQEQDCRRMAADRGWVILEPVYRENDTRHCCALPAPRGTSGRTPSCGVRHMTCGFVGAPGSV